VRGLLGQLELAGRSLYIVMQKRGEGVEAEGAEGHTLGGGGEGVEAEGAEGHTLGGGGDGGGWRSEHSFYSVKLAVESEC